MKKTILIICMILMALMILSCHKKPKITSIKVAYADYSFDKAVVNVISTIISSQTDLKVELVPVPEEDLAKALVDGRADLTFSLWAPNTHAQIIGACKDSIELISPYIDDLKMGLAVPEYLDIKNIEDLPLITAPFEKLILTPDSSNALFMITKEAIATYELNGFTIKEFKDESDLLSYAKQKFDKSENFVFATYRPHWIFAEMKLVMLNDSRNVFGTPEKAVIYSRKNFSKDLPKISSFLKQIKLTMDDVESLMKANEDVQSDPKVNAQNWFDSNIDRINLWINKSNEVKK